MHEDNGDRQEQVGAEEPREDYVAPALTDLGTFQELTEFNPSSTVTDAELGSL